MKLDIYQVDAFTSDIFNGNPACVVPLDKWISDEILLKIAQENAVAETAFYVKNNDKYHLRWFTPEIEMDLCGHATLATAHVIYSILGLKKEKIVFETLSGDLIVKIKDHLYVMNLPSRMPLPKKLPKNIYDSLNIKPLEVYKARDYLLLFLFWYWKGSQAKVFAKATPVKSGPSKPGPFVNDTKSMSLIDLPLSSRSVSSNGTSFFT